MTETGFQQLMAQATAGTGRFDHREHIHLAWLAVRHYGLSVAISLVSNGIQQTARYTGAPQKYNATVSKAWVELVAHHTHDDRAADFDTFAARNPALLDKRLLTRFYRPATLASAQARTGWTPPDLTPFPLANHHLERLESPERPTRVGVRYAEDSRPDQFRQRQKG